MKNTILLISIICFMSICLTGFPEDTAPTKTLLTYYPSPIGVYESIKIGGGGTSSTGQTYFLEMQGCSSKSNMESIFGESGAASVIFSQYPIIIAVEDFEENASVGDNSIYILEKGVYISTKNGNTPSPDFFAGDQGDIGLGTNTPKSSVHVLREGNIDTKLTLEGCSDVITAAPKIELLRNGGTIVAKTDPPSSGIIGQIDFKGFPYKNENITYDLPSASIEVRGASYPDVEFKIKTADVTRDSTNKITGVRGPTEKFTISKTGDIEFQNMPSVVYFNTFTGSGTMYANSWQSMVSWMDGVGKNTPINIPANGYVVVQICGAITDSINASSKDWVDTVQLCIGDSYLETEEKDTAQRIFGKSKEELLGGKTENFNYLKVFSVSGPREIDHFYLYCNSSHGGMTVSIAGTVLITYYPVYNTDINRDGIKSLPI
jgi:hypothetical protein